MHGLRSASECNNPYRKDKPLLVLSSLPLNPEKHDFNEVSQILHNSQPRRSTLSMDNTNSPFPPGLSISPFDSRSRRKMARSLPTPESSPDCYFQKMKAPKKLTNKIVRAYPTPPTSDDEQESSFATLKSESDHSIEFPLTPSPLPSTRYSKSTASKGKAHNTHQRGTSFKARRLAPKPSTDRFISSRTSAYDLSYTFRSTKATEDLTKSERLLRDVSITPDPFGRLILPRPREQRPTSARGRPGVGRISQTRSRTIGTFNAITLPQESHVPSNRQPSAGTIWNIGRVGSTTQPIPIRAVSNGRGGFLSSGSNAPMYAAEFLEEHTQDQETETMENRIARALDIDRTERLIGTVRSLEDSQNKNTRFALLQKNRTSERPQTMWINGEWVRSCTSMLDAPLLRDDYYCTVLAYCSTLRTLAVGLANRVYLWSEELGVKYPPDDPATRPTAYVTSLSFSSTEGGLSILATGRNTGQVCLWSLNDADEIRFKAQHSVAVSCISFKPVTTQRISERFGSNVATEELLVGDEKGDVYYYSIEWMTRNQVDIHGWNGSMKLLLRISVHSQQVCGLAWSPKGDYFATGANDNACCLFQVNEILKPENLSNITQSDRRPLKNLTDRPSISGKPAALVHPLVVTTIGEVTVPGHLSCRPSGHTTSPLTGLHSTSASPSQHRFHLIGDGGQKHKWIHSAAVKAIAFCPWQRGLIATGGGSNDRAIHFYHTFSGASLATINVYAQVTSLIWSNTRREIAATFGYAQPEHPYRIAVFSWPECRQIVAIPWPSDHRALLAISYPRGPGETRHHPKFGEQWYSRTAEEGCIVVACSDESVKFHEVWSGTTKSTDNSPGLLGGSAILEGLEGIDKEIPEVIR